MLDTTILVDGFGKNALNIREHAEKIQAVFTPLNLTYEIIFIGLKNTRENVKTEKPGPEKISCLPLKNKKYGDAIREAFELAQGRFIFMVDESLLLSPSHITKLWNERTKAETVIASRYLPGSLVRMPFAHFYFSRLLNRLFRRVLSLPLFDLSSGLRLYKSSILKEMPFESHDYDILLEILIKTYIHGYAIKEIPVVYHQRVSSRSLPQNARLFFTFLATAYRMWKLRNTIQSCDYDERAFNSPIFFQRYWQKQRHHIILNAASPVPFLLDIGCGSSRILSSLPHAIGMDIDVKKIRYMRKYDNPVLCGSIFQLPFKNETFDGVICSEVIEHIPKDESIIKEITRVLKPGGTLILGTPDYGSKIWVFIEMLYKKFAPGGYGDEHISHYTKKEMLALAESHGFTFRRIDCIFRSEMIAVFTKES